MLVCWMQGTKIFDDSNDQDTTDLHKCVAFIRDYTPSLDKSNVSYLYFRILYIFIYTCYSVFMEAWTTFWYFEVLNRCRSHLVIFPTLFFVLSFCENNQGTRAGMLTCSLSCLNWSFAFLLLEHLVGGLIMRSETSMSYIVSQPCGLSLYLKIASFTSFHGLTPMKSIFSLLLRVHIVDWFRLEHHLEVLLPLGSNGISVSIRQFYYTILVLYLICWAQLGAAQFEL